MSVYDTLLNQYDYDVRKTHDARWIDQKCTHDVLSMIADCIVEYVDNTEASDRTTIEFTVSDIWHKGLCKGKCYRNFLKA